MTHRYQAPEHTSAVFTSTGEKRADRNGVIALPVDAPRSDHAQLHSAGCRLIGEAEVARPAKRTKSSRKAPRKSRAKAKADAAPVEPAQTE